LETVYIFVLIKSVIFFSGFVDQLKAKKEQRLFKIEIFCYIHHC